MAIRPARILLGKNIPPRSPRVAAVSPLQMAIAGTNPTTWRVAVVKFHEALGMLGTLYKPTPHDFASLFMVLRGSNMRIAREVFEDTMMKRCKVAPTSAIMRAVSGIKGDIGWAEAKYLAAVGEDNRLELKVASRNGEWITALQKFQEASRLGPYHDGAKLVVQALSKGAEWEKAVRFANQYRTKHPAAAADTRLMSDVLRTTCANEDTTTALQACAALLAQGHKFGAENVKSLAVMPPTRHFKSWWEEAIRVFAAVEDSPTRFLTDRSAAPTLLKALMEIDYYGKTKPERWLEYRDVHYRDEVARTGTEQELPRVQPPHRLSKQWASIAWRLTNGFFSRYPHGSRNIVVEPLEYFTLRKSSEGVILVVDTNVLLWMVLNGVTTLDGLEKRLFEAYPTIPKKISAVLVPFSVYRELCGLLFHSRVKSKARWQKRLKRVISNPKWWIIPYWNEVGAHAFSFLADISGRHFESDPDRKINQLLMLLQYHCRNARIAATTQDTSLRKSRRALFSFVRYQINRMHSAAIDERVPATTMMVFVTFDKKFSNTCAKMGVLTFPVFDDQLSGKKIESSMVRKALSILQSRRKSSSTLLWRRDHGIQPDEEAVKGSVAEVGVNIATGPLGALLTRKSGAESEAADPWLSKIDEGGANGDGTDNLVDDEAEDEDDDGEDDDDEEEQQ